MDALGVRPVQDSVHDDHGERHPRRQSQLALRRDHHPRSAIRAQSLAVPAATYPDSLKGGLGDAGAAALGAFVDAGGTLLAFNDASDYAIEALALPVKNVLAGVRSSDFYAPGSIMRVVVRSRRIHSPPGYTAPESGRLVRGIARVRRHGSCRARQSSRAIPPRGGQSAQLAAGCSAHEKLAGKAAMVDVKRGKGTSILFGFRPQYRAQTMATYPLDLELAPPFGSVM